MVKGGNFEAVTLKEFLCFTLNFLSDFHLTDKFKCKSSTCSKMQRKWKESCNINTEEFLST